MKHAEMFCYTCGASREFNAEEPRFDVDAAGKLEINDFICTVCLKRIRLLKRVRL